MTRHIAVRYVSVTEYRKDCREVKHQTMCFWKSNSVGVCPENRRRLRVVDLECFTSATLPALLKVLLEVHRLRYVVHFAFHFTSSTIS